MSRKRRRARSSAPSQVTPLSRAEESAAAAPGLEKLAAEYPDEREELLIDAAAAWSEAGEHDCAVAVYDRLLADEDACDAPDLIRAFRPLTHHTTRITRAARSSEPGRGMRPAAP